jgi:hypothetical protein
MEESNNGWSDLEVFEHTGAKIGTPYVTISSRKSITLTAGFLHYAKEQISEMTHAIFSFSKSKNAIVFNFTNNPESPGATKMTKKANSIISARSFFNYYSIDTEKAEGKYEAKLENIPGRGNAWVVFLDKKL